MITCANPKAQYLSYKEEIDAEIESVLNGSTYILGDQVSLLEKKFSEFIGTNFSVGVANGTDAIEIALRALDIGIGDESDNSFQSWKDRALTAEKTIKEYERDNENLNFLIKNLERMILEK